MANAEAYDLTSPLGTPGKARAILARRLADIVCLPSSRISPPERWIVGDLLFEILRNSDAIIRKRCAARLADIVDAPSALVRMLASDSYDVAEPLLERSMALTDFDMLEIVKLGGLDHRIALARRERVSETIAAALAASGEPPVITALLKNSGSHLAPPTMEHIVTSAKDETSYARLAIKRAELRPRQAFRLFWWCNHVDRVALLDRFGVDRSIVIEAVEDVFPLAAEEARASGQDALVHRALKFVDRRQRNREAADASPYGSLEGAATAMRQRGATSEMIEEIARLAGIARPLLARMFDDLGGEALAVLCKATGANRETLAAFWAALGRAESAAGFRQAGIVYDSLSVEKAQTILRYWDWSNVGVSADPA